MDEEVSSSRFRKWRRMRVTVRVWRVEGPEDEDV